MSFISSLRAKVERQLGNLLVWNDWHLTKGELTRDIRRVLARPYELPPGAAPESGEWNYSSLTYASAEDAARAFRTSRFVYSRIDHPLLDKLKDTLLLFDPAAAHGVLTGHGMGAVEASFAALQTGDHIVASKFVFSSCRKEIQRLEKANIEISFVDGRDIKAWKNAIRPNTKMFWFENPGNPTTELVDIAAVANLAHDNGRDILVVVDNSLAFAAHRPLSLGADVMLTSLTKSLGLGTDNGGGAFMSNEGHDRLMRLTDEAENSIGQRDVVAGLTMSPRVAGVMLRRVAALPARFARQQKTALALAEYIDRNYPMTAVKHPLLASHPQADLARRQMTGSGVFSIDLGTKKAAFLFINRLISLGIKNVNNFGSAATSTAHPASTTHFSITEEERQEQGIGSGLVRISVGTERFEFLKTVFDKALQFAAPAAAQSRTPPTPAQTSRL